MLFNVSKLSGSSRSLFYVRRTFSKTSEFNRKNRKTFSVTVFYSRLLN